MTQPSLDPATLAAMSLEELRALWRRTRSTPVPAHASRDLLARALIYAAEVRRNAVSVRGLHGRLARLAEGFSSDADYTPPSAASLQPGAVLVRDWNGKRYAVTALKDGFLLDGERYESLSAVAKAITGVKWSGPRFFKLNGIAESKKP